MGTLLGTAITVALVSQPIPKATGTDASGAHQGVTFRLGDRPLRAWADHVVGALKGTDPVDRQVVYSVYLNDLGLQRQSLLARRTSPQCNCTLRDVATGPSVNGTPLLVLTGSSGAVGQLALVYRFSLSPDSDDIVVERVLAASGRGLRWRNVAGQSVPDALVVDQWNGESPSSYRVYRFNGHEFQFTGRSRPSASLRSGGPPNPSLQRTRFARR